jgi:hypothetical protein
LGSGRLAGDSQNEKSEEGETEHALTKTIHGQISSIDVEVWDRRGLPICDVNHISPEWRLFCRPVGGGRMVPGASRLKPNRRGGGYRMGAGDGEIRLAEWVVHPTLGVLPARRRSEWSS